MIGFGLWNKESTYTLSSTKVAGLFLGLDLIASSRSYLFSLHTYLSLSAISSWWVGVCTVVWATRLILAPEQVAADLL